MPSLFVITGRDQGARFEIASQPTTVTIGRDPGNAIQLHDTEVSRRHAEILHVGEQLVLSDLGSSNGTFLNQQRIARQELSSGDQLQLGRTILLYTKGGDSDLRDAGERVSIVGDNPREEPSRIVQTLNSQEESLWAAPELDTAQNNWLARARGNLQLMYRTALAVSHTLNIDQLLDRIMQLIFEWVEADRGCIMLMDPASGQLRPQVRRDRQPRGARPASSTASEETLAISRTILDYVLQRKEGVLTSNARSDERWDAAASIVRLGVREAICVPMQGRYGLVGVIYIDTLTPAALTLTQPGRKFGEDHLKLMIAIGHQSALAVEDTNYYSAMVRSERLAAMGQTIATLSHHIKNILQGIRGGSYLIEMGLTEHDEPLIRKGWDIVERNQKRISNMVLDMLTFSKEREPELSAADLNVMVADVVELQQLRAADKQIALIWEPAADLPPLIFDSEGLHRAVLNVLTNAIDAVEERLSASEAEIQERTASPAAENSDPLGQAEPINREPGRVIVKTELSADQSLARIAIADNGAGIDPDKIADIFNMFVSSKGSRGTGLGLPVSQKILQEHGGEIRVESEPGRGSRFILEFPAHTAEESKT